MSGTLQCTGHAYVWPNGSRVDCIMPYGHPGRCGNDPDRDRLRHLLIEMEWCEREHPDTSLTRMDVQCVRDYIDGRAPA